MAVTSAFSNFFSAIGELIASFFHTLSSLITTIISTITGLFTGVVNLVMSTVGNVLEVFGETGKFLFGNAFLFLIIGLGAFAYLKYQAQQGKPVIVGDKKIN